MVLLADDASRAAVSAWEAAGADAATPPPRRTDRRARLRHGDTVILFEARDRLRQLVLVAGETFQNQYGVFHHDVSLEGWGGGA